MHSRDFYNNRREELKRFFALRFGPNWRAKVNHLLSDFFTRKKALYKAEELARLHGFVPRDELPLERNFLHRLRLLTEGLSKIPDLVCYSATLGAVLEEFYGHRLHRSKHKQKHKQRYSDVIALEFLVFEDPAQRTNCPSAYDDVGRWKSFEEWLTIPLTIPEREPPGYPGPEGGKLAS